MEKPKRKILLIEDDADVARLLRTLLGPLGAEVLTATDGLEGIDLAVSEHPDLMLVDLNLPRVSGLETIRVVKAVKELSRIPVIILTGHASPENIKQAVEVGAVDFLVKANFLAGSGLERVRSALDSSLPARTDRKPDTPKPFKGPSSKPGNGN